MNTKKTIVKTLVAVMLTAGLFLLQQTTAAQSRGFVGFRGNSVQQASTPSANSNCKSIKASNVQVFDPATNVISGPVTNAGVLDGNLEDVINVAAGFLLTPDPNVFSYTTDLTITTSQGQLKLSPVTIQSVVTGAGAEWGHINPTTSTGRFAGATGTISVVFKPIGDPFIGPYEAQISAEICFAQ